MLPFFLNIYSVVLDSPEAKQTNKPTGEDITSV